MYLYAPFPKVFRDKMCIRSSQSVLYDIRTDSHIDTKGQRGASCIDQDQFFSAVYIHLASPVNN